MKRLLIATAASALLLAFAPGTAHADTAGPAVNFFKAPVPILGSVLSDSTTSASVNLKNGWTMYDPDGVCSARVIRIFQGTQTTIWSFTGSRSTTQASGKYAYTEPVNGGLYLRGDATDCAGNLTIGYGWSFPTLYQESAASYSAGWSTAAGQVWSGGAVFKSSTVGAKANFTFSGTIASLVSDKASNRGTAKMYIDGVYKATVNLASPTSLNRVLVWNTPYVSPNGSHVLTVQVASGRVDIDGLLVLS